MNTRNTNTAKEPHFTKAGPGRRHIQGDGIHKHLTIKQRRAGMFGKGIRNTITAKNLLKLLAKREGVVS